MPAGGVSVTKPRKTPPFHCSIDEATKYVAPEQLCVSPQCGFASTEEGNVLAEDEQWAKLAMAVEIAREIWG